jgi:hypothetical protein
MSLGMGNYRQIHVPISRYLSITTHTPPKITGVVRHMVVWLPHHTLLFYLQLHFLASPSSIRLLKPTNHQYAPVRPQQFWQVFGLANLLYPAGHIGLAGDLYAHRFAITNCQNIKYME